MLYFLLGGYRLEYKSERPYYFKIKPIIIVKIILCCFVVLVCNLSCTKKTEEAFIQNELKVIHSDIEESYLYRDSCKKIHFSLSDDWFTGDNYTDSSGLHMTFFNHFYRSNNASAPRLDVFEIKSEDYYKRTKKYKSYLEAFTGDSTMIKSEGVCGNYPCIQFIEKPRKFDSVFAYNKFMVIKYIEGIEYVIIQSNYSLKSDTTFSFAAMDKLVESFVILGPGICD